MPGVARLASAWLPPIAWMAVIFGIALAAIVVTRARLQERIA
jgi:hypothetical protein